MVQVEGGQWVKDYSYILGRGTKTKRRCCEMVNISIAKSCQFGGVANKSGGCAFPDRGKYLNRCAFTHERREGAAIKHAWIRTRVRLK